MQFDARPDSPDSDTLIDLPLQDRESVSGADLPASRGDLLFQEPEPSSSGRGFGVGMLVIGLVAGFGGGFLVGQRVVPPAPLPSAAQVTPPAQSESPTLPEPPVVPAPLDAARDAPSDSRGAQNFTEAPVVEPPSLDAARDALSDSRRAPPVAVQEPDVQPPAVVPREPPRSTLPVEPGTLQIASRPPGAQVFVDDVRVGTTPMTMSNVRPGAHRVRIELPGHRPWATSVNVEPGAQARVGASLEP